MPAYGQSRVDQSAKNAKQTADEQLDITAYLCPMTFVRTRLALDRMQSGQILAIRLRGEEPRTNVPASLAEQGHVVIDTVDAADGTTTVLVRKS